MKRLSLLITAALSLSLTLVPSTVLAGSTVGFMQVTVSVPKTCTLTTIPLSFGSYDRSAPDVVGSTTITMNCTLGASYQVTLDRGLNWSGGRNMNDGPSNLFYQLFTEGFGFEWGDDGATGFPSLARIGTGLNQTLTVAGKIPGTQNVPAGDYQDMVLVTVLY